MLKTLCYPVGPGQFLQHSSSGGGVGKEKTKSGVDDDNNDDGETESPDAKSAKKRNEGDGNERTASKKVKFS